MEPTRNRPPQDAPDMGALARRVLAHWPTILVTMVLGALVTLGVVARRHATFRSETVIAYREGIGRSLNGAEPQDSARNLGPRLKEMLLAQQTLRRIIDELHLYPEVVARAGYVDAVDQMRKKTEFKSRSTDTFAISFEGEGRDQAQMVCARMAEILSDETSRKLSEDNHRARELVEAELRRAEDELTRVEQEMSRFLLDHPEFAGASGGLGVEAERERKAGEEDGRRAPWKPGAGRQRLPKAGSAGARAPAVDPLLLSARAQAKAALDAAKEHFADVSRQFTDQHPDVREASERVIAAQEALRRANEAIADAQMGAAPVPDPYAGARAPAPPAATPAPSKPRQVDPDRSSEIISLETHWEQLRRERETAKGHRAELETKVHRAQALEKDAAAGIGPGIVVIDAAYQPGGPSNAPKRTVVLIGFALSLAAGIVVAAARGLFLDDRLYSANEIEGVVMVPVLGTVPRGRRRERKAAPPPPPRAGGRGRTQDSSPIRSKSPSPPNITFTPLSS
jgi:hypothetical protein